MRLIDEPGHPDIPWKPPAVPPPTSELRAALQTLEAQLKPATRKHAAYCVAKLLMCFDPGKYTNDETKLRIEVWFEACGDFSDELWTRATLELVQTWQRDKHYGRAPEPADFRACVQGALDRLRSQISRCKTMLEGVRQKAEPTPFVPEPEAVRLRTLRDSLRKIGQVDRAAVYDRKLDELVSREA